MATLTIKSIPDSLYLRLKARAANHRRSLNSEVIVCLEESVLGARNEPAMTLQRIRQLRSRTKGANLKDEFLRQAKDEGRE